MGNGNSGSSAVLSIFRLTYETRRIMVAQGIDAREGDFKASGRDTLFDYLKHNFSTLQISGSTAEYISDSQHVRFIIELIQSKDGFKNALTTPGIHVVYCGHSRYGRGTCFEPNAPAKNHAHGEFWEQGTNTSNGIYRLGYPFVPVALRDMEHHHYRFTPVAIEESQPPISERHPNARRQLSRITLPESLRDYVIEEFRSPSNRYYGYRSSSETNILLYAGWQNTRSNPFDIDATEMQCKVFCHFGCSSKLHYWRIVRKENYKNWRRDNPPTDQFAYFTTNPSDYKGTFYWMYYILQYDQRNNYQSWWASLEYAKRSASRLLRSERTHYQLY
jgi:hypothetical protein